MDIEAIYANVEHRDIQNTTGPQTQSHNQDEGKDLKRRGSRCLVLITVGLGLICVLLLVFIILLYITVTAERDMLKSLHDNNTDLMIEKHQLQNNFSSLSQKKLEMETRVRDLTAEKSQMETRVRDLTAEKSQMETRVRDLTAEKSQMETRVRDLTAEKSRLQGNFSSLSQKKLELETRVTSLSEELKKEASKRGWFFMCNELKSWSDSRQYCRDRGADLVIINTEEKQRFISSLTTERVWIGLSDREKEGNMKWVDNSTLNQGFWSQGQPDNYGGDEDCIELNYQRETLNSWNDRRCSDKIKGICEK